MSIFIIGFHFDSVYLKSMSSCLVLVFVFPFMTRCVCVCMCVCIYVYIYIYIYIYMCIYIYSYTHMQKIYKNKNVYCTKRIKVFIPLVLDLFFTKELS